MGIGFALGTGFVNAANKRQEENRDESRENRKLAMEVWVKDTRPRILAARAKDETHVNTMNTLMQDSTFKGQPARAFYAAKWMSTTGKDVTEFNNFYAQGDIPEELKAEQMKEMQKHFNFNSDTNSFAWKDQVPAVPQAQPQMEGAKQPNFFSKMMGTPDAGKDMNKGVSDMAKATGTDPNASTTSRFDAITVPGNFKARDKEAEARAQTAFSMMMKDEKAVANWKEVNDTYMKEGAEAALAKLTFIPLAVREDKEFKQNLKQALSSAVLQNFKDLKDPTGALAVLARGNATTADLADILGKNVRKPEERAALEAELKQKYGTPDSQIDWIALMADTKRFAELYPDPNTRKAVQQSVMSMINSMQMSTQQKAMAGIPGAEKFSAPGVNLTTSEQVTEDANKPVDPVVTPDPATVTPPAEVKKTATQEIEEVMNSEEGLTLKAKDPQKKGTEIKAPTRDEEIGAIAEKGTPDQIRANRNPVGLLNAVGARTKGGKEESFARVAEVASNITITPEVAARIMENEDYGNEWNRLMAQWVEPYLQEFGSMADAQAVVHPFGLAKINGDIKVVPPKKGN